MTSLYQDVKHIESLLKQHHELARRSINLNAATNLPSNLVRQTASSDALRRITAKLNGKSVYAGTRYLDAAIEKSEELARRLFKAKFTSLKPMTGNLAILSTLLGLLQPNNILLNLPSEFGGYPLPDRLRDQAHYPFRLEYLPFNSEEWNIEVDAAIDLITDLKPNLIMLGSADLLFPHPAQEISKVANEIGAITIYDGAHVLGLIAGDEFQDPLREGCAVLTGGVNKSFPGPHRGIILVNDSEETFNRVEAPLRPPPLLQSTFDLASTIAVGVACAEMLEFGREYARQVTTNARVLGQALHDNGVEGLLCPNKGFSKSHMVIQRVGKSLASPEGFAIKERLENANILVDAVVRYGVGEVTRLGMKEDEMRLIANFISAVIVEKEDPVKIANRVGELASRFQMIKYCFDEMKDAYAYFDVT